MRGEGLVKHVMEGRMKGRRLRGRERIGMIDDLVENSGCERERVTEADNGWGIKGNRLREAKDIVRIENSCE